MKDNLGIYNGLLFLVLSLIVLIMLVSCGCLYVLPANEEMIIEEPTTGGNNDKRSTNINCAYSRLITHGEEVKLLEWRY